MKTNQALINYASPLNFVFNLEDQLNLEQTLNHPHFGQIQIWRIKNGSSAYAFSFVANVSQKDQALLDIHLYRCKLQHQNLLEYYACFTSSQIGGIHQQKYFFEYHPTTLHQYIKNSGPLEEVYIWKYLTQIIDVMAFLQKQNRQHGRLTSHAILIDNNQNIKILDKFGQRSDIKEDEVYDLGLIAMELLTGKSTQLNIMEQLRLQTNYSRQLLSFISLFFTKQTNNFIKLQEILIDRLHQAITSDLFRQDYNNKKINYQSLITFTNPNKRTTIKIDKIEKDNKKMITQNINNSYQSFQYKQSQPLLNINNRLYTNPISLNISQIKIKQSQIKYTPSTGYPSPFINTQRINHSVSVAEFLI